MLEIITAGSILLCVLLIVLIICAPRIYVWWNKKLEGYSPNRAARRKQKYNHQPANHVCDYGKTGGAEHYDPTGDKTPIVR